MFAFIHQWFTDSAMDLDGLSENEVARAIETVISNTDTRLRAIGNYQRKLRPAVIEALLHARDLINQIPGPVEINRRSYAHHPMVHSLFGSVDQIGEVFSLSAEAQSFRKQVWSSGNEHLYGFLLMTLNRKTRPGFVLKNGIVQSDVLQKIAFFSDHSLVTVGGSEGAVRIALRERALEKMFLEYKRRVAEHTRRLSDLSLEQARLRRESTPDAEKQLAEIEREQQALSEQLPHLDDHLDLLIEVLTNPDEHCGLANRELQLDRNGVLQGESAQDIHPVPYAEITHGGITRAGLLVKYPLDELLEVDHLSSFRHLAL